MGGNLNPARGGGGRGWSALSKKKRRPGGKGINIATEQGGRGMAKIGEARNGSREKDQPRVKREFKKREGKSQRGEKPPYRGGVSQKEPSRPFPIVEEAKREKSKISDRNRKHTPYRRDGEVRKWRGHENESLKGCRRGVNLWTRWGKKRE